MKADVAQRRGRCGDRRHHLRTGDLRRVDRHVREPAVRKETQGPGELWTADPARVAELHEHRKRSENRRRTFDEREVAVLVLAVECCEGRRVLQQHAAHLACGGQRRERVDELVECALNHAFFRSTDPTTRGHLVVVLAQLGRQRALVDLVAGHEPVGLDVECEAVGGALSPVPRVVLTR